MKAIKRDDEIIAEPFSQWIKEHLDWLTTARPDGDGYELIEDYLREQSISTAAAALQICEKTKA